MPETKIDINLNSQEFGSKSDSAVKSLGAIGKAAGIAFAAVATGAALSVKAFADFETGLVGVGKTTDLSTKELDALGKSFRDLSTQIPLSTSELLEIAQTAGTLGVTGADNIEKFSVTIAKLSTATDDLKGEQAARQLSRILGITGDGVENIDKFASSIVALGNTFKTTEGAIAETSIGVASATTQFKLGAVNVAAISTALSSLGQRSEASATVVGESFAQIDNAIRKGGAGLANLERLTGLSGDQLRKTFKEDATEVFRLFNEGLGASVKAGASLREELEGVGIRGSRANRILGALSSQSQVLSQSLELANEEFKNATALNEEFERASNTLNNRTVVLGNNFRAVAQEIGARLAPAVTEVINFLVDLFATIRGSTAFEDFLNEISDLTFVVLEFIRSINFNNVIGTAEVALAALELAVGGISVAFTVLTTIISGALEAIRSIPRGIAIFIAKASVQLPAFVENVADSFGTIKTIVLESFGVIGKLISDVISNPTEILSAVATAGSRIAGGVSQEVNKLGDNVEERARQVNEQIASLDEEFRSDDPAGRNAIERVLTPDEEKVRQAFEDSRAVADEQKELITEDQQALLDAQKAVEEEDLKRRQKFNQDRLKEQIRFGKAFADINSVIRSEEVQGTKSATAELTQLTQSRNATLKGIGKAASVAQITIKTAESAMNIFAGFSRIPIIGQALGIAGAAAAVAFGAEQIARVTAAQDGGLITGGVRGMDSVPALLTPGELVVPEQNFEEVIQAVAAQRAASPAAQAAPATEGAEAGAGAVTRVEVDVNFSDDAIDLIETRITDRQENGTSILLNGEPA